MRHQNNLGILYSRGQGVQQDYVQAYKWVKLAASGFASSEARSRKMAIKYKSYKLTYSRFASEETRLCKAANQMCEVVAAKMTRAQIAEANKLVREWKPRWAEPSTVFNDDSRSLRIADRILYCHAKKDARKIGAGHWFFHTDRWVGCAEAVQESDGRWRVDIHYDIGKPLPDNARRFDSIDQLKAFVASYFEYPVEEVRPINFPDPRAARDFYWSETVLFRR
jgi:hypothetical protein